jgi:putative ABC transport system substrate-binding protein
MNRRAFITLLGGAAASSVSCCVSWPPAARAQQADRTRVVGMLSSLAPDDPEEQARNAAFLKVLQQRGWSEGRNLRIERRSTGGDAGRTRAYAAELAALAPDVIVTAGNAGLVPMLQVTRTIPIVFTIVPDPVGAGFVDSLSRPGGNATGFSQFEYGLTAKWLELLKEISPGISRVGYCGSPASPPRSPSSRRCRRWRHRSASSSCRSTFARIATSSGPSRLSRGPRARG